MASTINAKTTGVGGIDASGDASGVLALQTGGTTALTIDASQNVGIGVTPSAWKSTLKVIELQNGVSLSSYSAAPIMQLGTNWYDNGTNSLYKTSAAVTSYQQSSGAHYWYNAPSGTAGNAVSFTQAMTLDASGNLGIGTASPAYKLDVVGSIARISNAGGAEIITRNATSSTNWEFGVDGASNGFIYSGQSSAMVFSNSGTERMRLDSSGNLLVGGTSQIGGAKVTVYSERCLVTRASGPIAFPIAFYSNGGAEVGYISNTTTATSYNTSSDYRLKENIQPMQNALGVVAQLNPVTYNWKSDGSTGQGFIAHELQVFVPDAVVGEKDAVDEEGNPVYQGIDTSFLVATLCKAIQELKAIIDTQNARIEALEAK